MKSLKNYTASIIIINKNDLGIANTLDALRKINRPCKTEVIVVDASTISMDNIKNKHKEAIWINFINKTHKRVTIPEQRNQGVCESKGDFIVYLDASCIPVKNWLVSLITTAVKDNEMLVSGKVQPDKINEINTISGEIHSKYVFEAPTANILINRKVFDKIGFFNENETYGQDMDFTWRAIEAGFKIRYLSNALVLHNMGSFSEQYHRMYRYGKSRLSLYLNHKYRIWHMPSKDIVMLLIYPLFIIFLPISILFPFYPLLLLIPLIKNVKKNPFLILFYNLCFSYGVIKELYSRTISFNKTI